MTDNTLSIADSDAGRVHNANIESGRSFQMDPRDLPADHPDANLARDLYVRQGVEGLQNGDAPPPADAEYIAAQDPVMIVRQVEMRVEKLTQQLAENVGFDSVTGDPVPLLKGRVRENAVRELAQLQHSTLPFARIQAAEVARAKAALPTQAERLQAEADAAAAKRKAALARADELEAEEEAKRILAARRRQTMG